MEVLYSRLCHLERISISQCESSFIFFRVEYPENTPHNSVLYISPNSSTHDTKGISKNMYMLYLLGFCTHIYENCWCICLKFFNRILNIARNWWNHSSSLIPPTYHRNSFGLCWMRPCITSLPLLDLVLLRGMGSGSVFEFFSNQPPEIQAYEWWLYSCLSSYQLR